jgi:glutathione-regulated potassium-efflux system ancillary protein KefG
LLDGVRDLDGVTVHDLYERLSDASTVDPAREQALLLAHDVIVLHHPFYWYSAPALLKEWMDLTCSRWGGPTGEGGVALRGKLMLNAITTGGSAEAYRAEGKNRFTIRELLAPFDQSAHLCGMTYLAPFVVHGALRLGDADDVEPHVRAYRALLTALRDDTLDLGAAQRAPTLRVAAGGVA